MNEGALIDQGASIKLVAVRERPVVVRPQSKAKETGIRRATNKSRGGMVEAMPNPNYPLVELEKLVEDNRVALERAESLLAALRDQSHAKGDAPVNSQLGEDQDGAPGPKSSPSIQRDSDKRDAWLDLENLARVEVTSEGLPGWPISSALSLNLGAGWRSKEPGMQTIRLIFAEPKSIQRIQAVFVEEAGGRTQEFVLRWLPKGETAYREIVRQQYVFSPSGSTREIEDYKVDLKELAAVELCIKPDLSAGDALASLAKLRLA